MGTLDPVAAFFLICFLVGLIFSVLSFLLGSLSLGHGGHDAGGHVGHVHTDGHGHLDGAPTHALPHPDAHADPHGHGHAPGAGHAQADHAAGSQPAAPSPLNLSTLMSFLVGFGGVGFIAASGGTALPVALGFAAAVGLVGASAVYLFLTRLLLRHRAYMEPESRVLNSIGRVTVPISATGVGEIVFSRAGTRRSEGARSASGRPIARGTEVVVVGYERGIALVEPFADYVGRGAAGTRAQTPPVGSGSGTA